MTFAHESGEVVSLTHRPPLPAGHVPGTHFQLVRCSQSVVSYGWEKVCFEVCRKSWITNALTWNFVSNYKKSAKEYARIVWELVSGSRVGSAEHSLRTVGPVGTALIHVERRTARHEANSRFLPHVPACLQIAILFHRLAANTNSVSITKVTRSMPLKSIIVLYSKNDAKHINILLGPNTEPLYVQDNVGCVRKLWRRNR
jgi:hypothetical protein